jgi:hypothetical protein
MPWERCYDKIRVARRPEKIYAPPLTDAELDDIESQLGCELPVSYRAFMKRFGPGQLHGRIWVYPVKPQRRSSWSLTGITRRRRNFWAKYPWGLPNKAWLSSVVYFASNYIYVGDYVWDPAAVTRRRPNECRVYSLPRSEQDRPVAVADSFWGFVEWADAEIRSRREREGGEPQGLEIPIYIDGKRQEHIIIAGRELQGDEILFYPAYLRTKKSPPRRDVTRWLAWNDSQVLGLARAIRDEGCADALPILADALEEAGCTSADLLASCRHGVPEVDGTWVLRVLLGKE